MVEAYIEFLPCETPDEWVQCAIENLDTLLIDHANCEKKAAATAMNLMYRHVDKPDLLSTMSQLAREELLHFQQLVTLLQERGVSYLRLSPSRYAGSLRKHISVNELDGLVDTLIIGAYIEARSCERFDKLVPFLDGKLAKFYRTLIKSEARHFLEYLELAEQYSRADISPRIDFFAMQERALILGDDHQLRFHSGKPV